MDEWLTRVVRESGSWAAAELRIRHERGAEWIGRASQIALRERGAGWLRGERSASMRRRGA